MSDYNRKTREERKLEWRVARVMMMTAAVCVFLAAMAVWATYFA